MSSPRPPFDDPTRRHPPVGRVAPAPGSTQPIDASGSPAQPEESAPGINGVTRALPANGLASSSPADSDATVAIYRTAHALATDGSETIAWHQHVTGPVLVPVPKVRHRWRKIAGRTLSKAWSDSLFGMSSQAAFWCALSTAPLLLALLGMIGYVVGWYFPAGTIDQVREQILLFLNTIFNDEVANNLVGDTVNTILRNGQADVVSIGLVISIWAGSSAMSAFVESITIAYNQHEFRHPVAERFFALALYIIALAAGIIMLPLLAIGPEYLPRLFPEQWRDQVATIVNYAYFPVIAFGLILMLSVLYKVAPKHKHPWYRGVPGAFLAAAVFIVASVGLRLYLYYVYSHGLTYGALATPITFLLFYYFVSMAVIIGAQFNNAMLEYFPPGRSKREQRKWRAYDPARDAAAPENPASTGQP